LCQQVKELHVDNVLKTDVLHIIQCYEAGIPSLYRIQTVPQSVLNPCGVYAQMLDILKEFDYLVHLTDMIPLIDEYLEYVTFRY
jgi:hypothetical protein